MDWLFGNSKPVLGEPVQEDIEYGKSHCLKWNNKLSISASLLFQLLMYFTTIIKISLMGIFNFEQGEFIWCFLNIAVSKILQNTCV